jgi:serine/threonine-protein kinase ATR
MRQRIDLGSFSQAIILVSLLLDSFSPQAAIEGLPNRRSFNLRQNLPWISNGYNRLRKVVAKWMQRAGPTLTPEEEQDILEFMAYAHRFCVSDTSGSALRSDVCLASTWAQCLSDIISPSISYPLPVLQTGLIHFLDEALQAVIDSEDFAQQLRESFLSALVEIKDKDGNFMPMEPGLLVMISLLCSQIFIISRGMS